MRVRLCICLSILLAANLSVADTPRECKDIQKGDVAACQAKAKRQCTQEKYWDRRACEDEIVAEMDVCIARKDDVDARCLAARTIESNVCRAYLRDKPKEFVAAANALERDLKTYAATRAEYGMCSCGLSPKTCDGVAAKLTQQLTEEADRVLGIKWLEEAKQHLAEYKKTQDDMEYANAEGTPDYAKKEAQELLDIEAKIPAAFRVKEKELRGVVTAADAFIAEVKQAEKAAIGTRSCPAGKTAEARWAKMIKAHIGPADAKKIAIMRQGDLIKSRDGLISRESILIINCVRESKDDCAVSKMGVYREKPPGGDWTSWQVSVGGGYPINCAKLR